jgi:putative N6-adenine-specific DNA methylase
VRFFVTCAKGTEGPLRRELADLHIRGPRGATGGVSFEGGWEQGLRACLWSRVGMRVLLELGAFEAPDAHALYTGARAVDWREHLDQRHTLAVSATVRDNPALSHSGFAALKVKDAVVDALRDQLGARPDVDTADPDVRIVLHLDGARAHLYLDLAGEPLHRRGYRVAMTDAPLKENLAAAILALGGAATDQPFLDPMAGSGTLAIEQALRARDIAPGLNRRFGFQRWPTQTHLPLWKTLVDEARADVRPRVLAPIRGRDIAPPAIAAARQNAAAAGVAGDIAFEVGTLMSLRIPEGSGTFCANPPYGERVGERDELVPTYQSLVDLFARYPGWRAVVLSGNPLFSRVFLRRPDITHRLWNGPLETRLLVYNARVTA